MLIAKEDEYETVFSRRNSANEYLIILFRHVNAPQTF